MGMLDGILGQIGGVDKLAGMATQLGLSPAQVQMAVTALGQAHPQPGDTVAAASAATGFSPEVLSSIVTQLGGENALAQVSGMIDRDGDGNPLNDLAGMAGKLFG